MRHFFLFFLTILSLFSGCATFNLGPAFGKFILFSFAPFIPPIAARVCLEEKGLSHTQTEGTFMARLTVEDELPHLDYFSVRLDDTSTPTQKTLEECLLKVTAEFSELKQKVKKELSEERPLNLRISHPVIFVTGKFLNSGEIWGTTYPLSDPKKGIFTIKAGPVLLQKKHVKVETATLVDEKDAYPWVSSIGRALLEKSDGIPLYYNKK